MGTNEYPLISAILLAGRVQIEDILASIKCFESQTYPNKQLVIVNNCKTQFAASVLEIPPTPNVFLIDTPTELSAGQARNAGIEAASGSIIAQFDADYWFSPSRLAAQVATMANEKANISVLASTLFYSFVSGRARMHTCTQNAILGTMVFSRHPKAKYPDVEHHEELGLLQSMLQNGLRPIAMAKPELACKYALTNGPRIYQPIANSDLSADQLETIQQCLRSRVTVPC